MEMMVLELVHHKLLF